MPLREQIEELAARKESPLRMRIVDLLAAFKRHSIVRDPSCRKDGSGKWTVNSW